jgi:phosphatidylglycerol:prolipoprotein diacylglycerol transferase
MFPTLVSIGSFQLQTMSVIQAIAFFASALVIWRRAREEHYSEPKVFDGFLLSFIVGWLSGRVGYFLLNWEKYGFDVFKWLNFVQYPGSQLLVALVAATLYMYFYAKKQKWDAFEVLDWWAQAMSMGLFWLNIGYFFAGTRFGTVTNLPWGIVFPGVFEKRHPIQAYYALFHAVMYRFLYWLEFNYRSFEWYRAGKKTAQTGFLFSTFLISYAVFSLLMSFLHVPSFVIADFGLDVFLYLGLALFGFGLILARSNRVLYSFKQGKFLAVKK